MEPFRDGATRSRPLPMAAIVANDIPVFRGTLGAMQPSLTSRTNDARQPSRGPPPPQRGIAISVSAPHGKTSPTSVPRTRFPSRPARMIDGLPRSLNRRLLLNPASRCLENSLSSRPEYFAPGAKARQIRSGGACLNLPKGSPAFETRGGRPTARSKPQPLMC